MSKEANSFILGHCLLILIICYFANQTTGLLSSILTWVAGFFLCIQFIFFVFNLKRRGNKDVKI